MRLLLASLLLCFSAFGTDLYLDPIMVTAGSFQTITNYTEHITLSGTTTSGAAQRGFVGFPMAADNTLKVFLPPGITGTCTHGPCTFAPITASAGGSCDRNSAWPQNAQGKVSVRMVACVDFAAAGTVSGIVGADTIGSNEAIYAGSEGSQTIQGSCGPGPITFRNNDMGFTGNPIHFADDCSVSPNGPVGITTLKHDYWIYRNRFYPFWAGMNHWLNPGRNGNLYGSRNQIIEWKGVFRAALEGNYWAGNFNEATQAHQGSPIVIRNVNQGVSDTLIANNFFQHIAAGFLLNDYNNGITAHAPSGTKSTVANNVMLDINRMGPDIYGIGGVSLTAGSGSYAVAPGYSPYSGQGRLLQGPGLVQGLSIINNTIPDIAGAFPGFDTTSSVKNGGLFVKDNFLSFNSAAFMYGGIGLRESEGGDGAPNSGPPCTSDGNPYNYPVNSWLRGYALLNCAWPNNTFAHNVILSHTFTPSQLNTDGWGATNSTPGNSITETAIWPKYNLNPCNSNQPWKCLIDPETMRLPPGSSYAGYGADITQLEAVMGLVRDPQAAFDASNNLVVTWLSPDTIPYTIDVATTGQLYGTFTRIKTDAGGSRNRKVVVPASNFAAHTSYDVRINSETGQAAINGQITSPIILSVKSN